MKTQGFFFFSHILVCIYLSEKTICYHQTNYQKFYFIVIQLCTTSPAIFMAFFVGSTL